MLAFLGLIRWFRTIVLDSVTLMWEKDPSGGKLILVVDLLSQRGSFRLHYLPIKFSQRLKIR